MTEEIYELISLSIEMPYELEVEEAVSKACEDNPEVTGDRSFDPSPTKSTKSWPSTTALQKRNLTSSSITTSSTVWVTSWKVATNKWPASAKCHSLIKVLIRFGYSLIKMWYLGCCFHWFLQLCLCNWFVCSNFAPEYLEERNNEKKYQRSLGTGTVDPVNVWCKKFRKGASRDGPLLQIKNFWCIFRL